MIHRKLRRPVTALAVAFAVSSASLGTAATSVATTSTQRAKTANGWLAAQLVDGSHFESTFGTETFPDQGLTIDAILAFAAAKNAEPKAQAATTWLTQPSILSGYVGDGVTESYSGAHAKAALALQVRGLNPRAVAGRNLITELQGLQASTGRFQDTSQFGDFSNAFGQSLGILALRRANVGTTTASSYLIGQSCSNGGVPIQFAQATCTADVDATAIAVQAFLASGRTIAATRALNWLITQQQPNGGFGANTNANSTGLAAAALAIGGRPVPAASARTALGTLQQGCTAAATDRGAIALDSTGFQSSSATRATPQAVLGLTSANLATLRSTGAVASTGTLSCPAVRK